MSVSKNKIKYLRSLRLKKFRQKYNNFIVEGDKMVREILAEPHLQIEELYALPAWVAANAPLLSLPAEKINEISEEELSRISGLKNPNQVLVVLHQLSVTWDENEVRGDLSLYLDDVQDPGNLGTIMRIADWFGISHVFCSPDSVDLYNPKVIQATMGAFLRVKVIETELSALRKAFPEVPFYGAVLGGDSIFEAAPPSGAVVVLGNEGRGISAGVESLLTHRITIPRAPQGGAESLNVAVAAGIVCAVFRHQQKK